MDELDEPQVDSVGQQLRAAREEKGLTLEDVASQTRIPRRHLEALENSEWDKLPAPTYTTGFAKSYASAVGLDRTVIGDQIRNELGGTRPVTATAEIFEPADPARTMPKWLVFGAIAAVILLVVLMSWLSRRSLEGEPAGAEEPVAAAPQQPAQAAPQPASVAPTGQVVITANAPAWVQITDQGKTLFQGEMTPGQRFEVPTIATAPLLKVGKPEALQVTVGGTTVPPVAPAGRVASNISLLPADLARGGNAGSPSAQPASPTGNTAG